MVRFARRVRRRTSTRKASAKPRRVFGARFRRRVFGKKVYKFSEPYELSYGADINVAASSQGGGILTFSLNNLLNVTSYQALFDLYKIDKVTVKILPLGNMAPTGYVGSASGASAIPQLFIAPNRDFYVPVPASESDILNDDGCRVINLTRPVTLTLWRPRPKVLDANGATIDYGLMPNRIGQWLTTGGNAQTINQVRTEYYGFRWWINNLQSGGPVIPKVIYTLHFSMKERD